MANSFNISDKPEIAEVDAKLVLISAAVNLIKTDTTAILIDTAEIDSIKERTANLPDDPASKTNIDDLYFTLNAASTAIAAIKLKTDLLPLKFRGKYYDTQIYTTENTWQTVIDKTGHGKLYTLAMSCSVLDDTVEVRLTTDGTVWTVIDHTGDTTVQSIIKDSSISVDGLMTKLPYPLTEPRLFDIEFSTSLLVQVRRSLGDAANVWCGVSYALDPI